jgi:hypothetical protein
MVKKYKVKIDKTKSEMRKEIQEFTDKADKKSLATLYASAKVLQKQLLSSEDKAFLVINTKTGKVNGKTLVYDTSLDTTPLPQWHR